MATKRRRRRTRDIKEHLARLGRLRRQIDVRQAACFDLHTDGKGLWSNHARKVHVTGYSLFPYSHYGELRVYFTRRSWSVAKHGLIYTDHRFLRQLKEMLEASGYSEKALRTVDYSEQGMQGGVGMQMRDDYVSLDAGEPFVIEYMRSLDSETVYRIMAAEMDRQDESRRFWSAPRHKRRKRARRIKRRRRVSRRSR